MIIEEYTDDAHRFIRRYSDRNVKIQNEQTKSIYNVAINLANSNYTYIETNIPIGLFDINEIRNEITNLNQQVLTIQETNDMLLECLLEMSEIVYT